jgi:hypothetical protein
VAASTQPTATSARPIFYTPPKRAMDCTPWRISAPRLCLDSAHGRKDGKRWALRAGALQAGRRFRDRLLNAGGGRARGGFPLGSKATSRSGMLWTPIHV